MENFMLTRLRNCLLTTGALLYSLNLFAQNPLPIPELLEGKLNEKGEKTFKLNIQEGEVEFFSGIKTKTLGINGPILGPTLKVKRGDLVNINVNNQLTEKTTLHWHGMHLPAKMDGGPHQMIESKTSWNPEFKINQEAATLWYHPHLLGKTGEHVYRGLAGMIIIEDENSESLDLPNDYGYDDLPIIIQDRRFNEKKQLQYIENTRDQVAGMMGNQILINGALDVRAEVPSKLTRLRILNGSNATVYRNVGMSDGRKFYQIATDGGFVEKPVELDNFVLAPGERIELLVDFSADFGKELAIVERYQAQDGSTQSFPLLPIKVSRKTASTQKMPEKLNDIEWFELSDDDTIRQFRLMLMNTGDAQNPKFVGMVQTDGNSQPMSMKSTPIEVKLNTEEVWVIGAGDHMFDHPFHVHDVQFQILARTVGNKFYEPYAWEKGWKDTVYVTGGMVGGAVIKMRFKDYSDPDSPYMYHCHNLEHEDLGMMGQFVIVP